MALVRLGARVGFLGVLVAVGCSSPAPPAPPVGTLKGTVTLDSLTVPKGFVVVVGMDPNSALGRGAINADGSYTVENAPAGPVRLFIELPPLPPDMDPRLAARPKGPPGAGKGAGEAPPQPFAGMDDLPQDERRALEIARSIPKSYLSPHTTPLVFAVQPNEMTEFDIRLSSKAIGLPDPSELPGGPPGPLPPRRP